MWTYMGYMGRRGAALFAVIVMLAFYLLKLDRANTAGEHSRHDCLVWLGAVPVSFTLGTALNYYQTMPNLAPVNGILA